MNKVLTFLRGGFGLVRHLLPRTGRGWLWFGGILVVVVLLVVLEPVISLFHGLSVILAAVLEPLVATPGGRIVLLNLMVVTALFLRVLDSPGSLEGGSQPFDAPRPSRRDFGGDPWATLRKRFVR